MFTNQTLPIYQVTIESIDPWFQIYIYGYNWKVREGINSEYATVQFTWKFGNGTSHNGFLLTGRL